MNESKMVLSCPVEFFRVSRWAFSFSGKGVILIDSSKSTLTFKGKRIWGASRYLGLLLLIWLGCLLLCFLLTSLVSVTKSVSLFLLTEHLAAFLGQSIVYLIFIGPFIVYVLSWILNLGSDLEKKIKIAKVRLIGRDKKIFKIKILSYTPYVISFELKGETLNEVSNFLDEIFPIH